MNENYQNLPQSCELIVLHKKENEALSFHIRNGLIVQLLSIRDHHPQWRTLRREEAAIASHAYTAQMKNFSAPRLELVKL